MQGVEGREDWDCDGTSGAVKTMEVGEGHCCLAEDRASGRWYEVLVEHCNP